MSAPGGIVARTYVEVLPALDKYGPTLKKGLETQAGIAQKQVQAIPAATGRALKDAEKSTTSSFARMQNTARAGAGRIGGSIKSAFGALGGGQIAGLFAVAGVVEFGKKSVDTFENVARQSLALQRVMGGSVKSASEWRGAMQLAGVSADQFQTSVRTLSKQINAADLGKKSGFDQLGLAVKDAQGHLKPMDQLLPQIADKLKAMAPGAQRNAVAVQLFGRAGLTMLPFLLRGSSGMEQLRKKADELGITIGDKQASQFKKSAAAHRELTARIQGLQIWIGERLVPAIDKFFDIMSRYVVPALMMVVKASVPVINALKTVVGWVVQNWKAMLPLAGVLAGFAAVWVANWIRMQVVATINAIKMAAAWLIALGPIAWITAAVVGIATLIILNWTKISAWTKRIWGDVWNFLKGLWDTIWRFLKTWGPLALAVLMPFLGIPLLIWQHWSQITKFLGQIWHDVWTFLKTWGPWALVVLAPFIGIPLIIWQHWSAIVDFGRRAISGALNGAKNAWHAFASWLGGIGRDVTNAVGAAGQWLYNIGADAVRGLWNGIKSLGSWIWDQVKKIIPGWIKGALGIKSPPDWAVEIGKWIAKGLANGIKRFPHLLGNLAAMARKKIAETAQAGAGALQATLQMLGGATVDVIPPPVPIYEQAYALGQFGKLGWAASQIASLIALWNGESRWNPYATNPSSGAYGIPQALPAEKMASAGGDWQTNPATQIRWGEAYIKAVYGTPSNAYAAWVSRHPHWYGRGLLPTAFNTPTLIGVGERGREVVSVTPDGGNRPPGGGFDYDKLAAAMAAALAGLAFRFDADGLARIVTRRQAATAARGVVQ